MVLLFLFCLLPRVQSTRGYSVPAWSAPSPEPMALIPTPSSPLYLTLGSFMCIAVNYIDTLLVIYPILAKFKPGIVGQSNCLKSSNPPPGRLGRKVRFCIQVFFVYFGGFLKLCFGRVFAQPCSISVPIKFRKTSLWLDVSFWHEWRAVRYFTVIFTL